MVTRAWKVYGMEGHRQRESFCESYKYDFSKNELLKCSIATAQERINLQLLKSHVTVQKSAKVNFLNRYQTEFLKTQELENLMR